MAGRILNRSVLREQSEQERSKQTKQSETTCLRYRPGVDSCEETPQGQGYWCAEGEKATNEKSTTPHPRPVGRF